MEPTKVRQVNEAQDRVFEAPKKEQGERIKKVEAKNQQIVTDTRGGEGAEQGEWELH